MSTPTENNLVNTIFLVDDDAFCLDLYRHALANLGYKDIHCFDSSAGCLDQLALQPDVIFLDYQMDNLNGIELLKKIKRFNPNSVVVFISGQENINVAVNALKYGAYDYINKCDFTETRLKESLQKVEQVKSVLVKYGKRNRLKSWLNQVAYLFPVALFHKFSSK